MKRYMLISVIENRIGIKRFETHEEAYEEMLNRLCANSEFEREDCPEGECKDCDIGYDANSAYVFDGRNGDNYSWQIVDLFDDNEESPLSLDELRQMDGEIVYWLDEKTWGRVVTLGRVVIPIEGEFANRPQFIKYQFQNYKPVSYDIETRRLKLYRRNPQSK